MENYIKNNIQGEILIPLETYYNQKETSKIIPKKICELNYKTFRSIVFTNEYLHFFLAIFLSLMMKKIILRFLMLMNLLKIIVQ